MTCPDCWRPLIVRCARRNPRRRIRPERGDLHTRRRCRPAVGAAIAPSTRAEPRHRASDLLRAHVCATPRGLRCVLDPFAACTTRDRRHRRLAPAAGTELATTQLEPAQISGKFRDTPVEPAFEAPTTPAASNGSRSKRTGLLLGCVGVALFLVGAALATLPTLKDWTPPPELSIAQSTKDHSVAQVQLGSVGPVQAKLEITEAGNKVVWHTNLAKTTGVQRVDLPADLLHKGSRVELLARGQDVRWVNGWVEIEPPPTAGSSVRF